MKREENPSSRWNTVAKAGRFLWPCLALFLHGCFAATEPGGAPQPLAVTVSIAPQAWLVEEIGAEQVAVTVLVRPGESPATFQPSDAEVSRVMRSVLYFRIGVPFEHGPWFEALEASGGPLVVDARQAIERRPIEGHDHPSREGGHVGSAKSSEELDPHVWLSPPLLTIQARTVAAALIEQDPTHRDVYMARLARLETRLDDLDRQLRDRLSSIAGRAFFVFHPVWGYFADQYGLRQIAIETAGREPTDRELTELQRQARAEDARVIFVQPQIRSRSAAAVAAAIGGRVEVLDPLRRDVVAGLEEAAERLLAAHAREE